MPSSRPVLAIVWQEFCHEGKTPAPAHLAELLVLSGPGEAGLALEAPSELSVLGKAGAEHLERDLALQGRLEGLVHRGHAALAQRLEDLVAADGGAGGEGHALTAASRRRSRRRNDYTLRSPAAARVSVDAKRAEVRVDGREVAVTARELLALAALAEDPGALVTKDDLALKVWPESGGVVSDDSIEQLMSRLRRKLGDDARQPRYLLAVRGLGYRLFASEDPARR